MDIAEKVEYSSDYLNAAYNLCNLVYFSESHKIPKLVEQIEQTVKDFKNPPEHKYIYRKVQQFKHKVWAHDPTQSPENRAASLNFYRRLIHDFEEDGRIDDMFVEIAEMATYFGEELGKDSVLYYASKVYEFYNKNDREVVKSGVNFLYGRALFDKKYYTKAILVFKEIIPLCGIKEPVPLGMTEQRLEGDYSTLAKTYRYLAESYLGLGNIKDAQEYLQKFADATDGRQKQAVGNAVSDLETKYDTEKKEMENQALVSQNKLIQSRFQYSIIAGILLLGLLAASIFFFLKMRKSKQELERINEGKNQLFEIIAHDLKGPVSSFSDLSFNVSHLIKNQKYNRLLELAEYYEKAGRKINYILTNLLDWAISQKDHFVHQPQTINVKTEINQIIEELNYSLVQKNIKVDNKIKSDASMFFDKDAFKVILRNLLHNAIKFSPKDSTVIVDYDAFGLKVKDNGIGINAETIQKVLKKERVQSRFGTNAEKGNGIGLSTCVKLAEQNKAKISIKSPIGEGAIFTLTNPK